MQIIVIIQATRHFASSHLTRCRRGQYIANRSPFVWQRCRKIPFTFTRLSILPGTDRFTLCLLSVLIPLSVIGANFSHSFFCHSYSLCPLWDRIFHTRSSVRLTPVCRRRIEFFTLILLSVRRHVSVLLLFLSIIGPIISRPFLSLS